MNNRYEELLTGLSARTVAAMAALWDGETLTSYDAALAALLAAHHQGWTIGEIIAAATIETELRTPHAVNVAAVEKAEGRITQALATITRDTNQDTFMQITRLADNTPKQAAADATKHIITNTPTVTGWGRALDSNACQLCQWWWREGRIWPKDHPMPRHPGCTCQQQPVTQGA